MSFDTFLLSSLTALGVLPSVMALLSLGGVL